MNSIALVLVGLFFFTPNSVADSMHTIREIRGAVKDGDLDKLEDLLRQELIEVEGRKNPVSKHVSIPGSISVNNRSLIGLALQNRDPELAIKTVELLQNYGASYLPEERLRGKSITEVLAGRITDHAETSKTAFAVLGNTLEDPMLVNDGAHIANLVDAAFTFDQKHPGKLSSKVLQAWGLEKYHTAEHNTFDRTKHWAFEKLAKETSPAGRQIIVNKLNEKSSAALDSSMRSMKTDIATMVIADDPNFSTLYDFDLKMKSLSSRTDLSLGVAKVLREKAKTHFDQLPEKDKAAQIEIMFEHLSESQISDLLKENASNPSIQNKTYEIAKRLLKNNQLDALMTLVDLHPQQVELNNLLSAAWNHPSAIELLVNKGADPNETIFADEILESVAKSQFHQETLGKLLKNNVGSEDQRVAVVRLLLERGKTVKEVKDYFGKSKFPKTGELLHEHVDSPEDLEPILQLGANPNTQDVHGGTILHRTSEEKVVDLMAKYGANMNAKDNEGNLPMHSAVGMRSPEMIKTLRRHGSWINTPNKEGIAPVDIETKNWAGSYPSYRENVFQALLDSGINLERKKKGNWTLLQVATAENELDAIKRLLKKGADPNTRDSDGITPLMNARSEEAAQLLLKYGANPRARDKKGNHVMAYHNDSSALDEIFNAGGKKDLRKPKTFELDAKESIYKKFINAELGTTKSRMIVEQRVVSLKEVFKLARHENAGAADESILHDRLGNMSPREMTSYILKGQTPLHYAAENLSVSDLHDLLVRVRATNPNALTLRRKPDGSNVIDILRKRASFLAEGNNRVNLILNIDASMATINALNSGSQADGVEGERVPVSISIR